MDAIREIWQANRLPHLVVFALCVLAGCSREPAVQAKQESGPILIKTAPVTLKQMQRDV